MSVFRNVPLRQLNFNALFVYHRKFYARSAAGVLREVLSNSRSPNSIRKQKKLTLKPPRGFEPRFHPYKGRDSAVELQGHFSFDGASAGIRTLEVHSTRSPEPRPIDQTREHLLKVEGALNTQNESNFTSNALSV